MICASKLTKWRTAIHGTGGDFTVTVTKSTFVSSEVTVAGIDIKYSLDVKDRTSSQAGTSAITFSLITEDGSPKICGES